MSTVARSPLSFEGTFVRDLEGLHAPWGAAPLREPRTLVVQDDLARDLGIDPDALRTPDGVAALFGQIASPGSTPVAQAYAGHQFGGWSGRLGDGRALLLGELVGPDGRRRDVHLKGSGRTPFARGGDGKAAVGPMLREHVVGEALHALGIPTSRALAVIATGEEVLREAGALPGAVLARVAASHLRVGSFQFAARVEDRTLLPRLAEHAIARHHPDAADADRPPLALFEAVVEAQASLVARWMLVGFVHGVLNTDNVTISGESIDFGPCAFMEAHDPLTVFSSIDQAGRYAYGNQPQVTAWNLARFAEALVPLLGEDTDAAVASLTGVLETFPRRYREHHARGMRAKLGLDAEPEDDALADDLLELMTAQAVDHTLGFRRLSAAARGDDAPLRALFADDPATLDAWLRRWRAQLAAHGRAPEDVARDLDAVNPVVVPRNHLVEKALEAATTGDLGPYEALVAAVREPFVEHEGRARFAEPAPAGFTGGYRTFCGT